MSKDPKWDDTVEIAAPSWDDTIDPNEISKAESAARGGAQGISLGFVDELVGTGRAMYDDAKALVSGTDANNGVKPEFDQFGNVTNGSKLTGDYEKYRDEYRAADKKAKDANPKTFVASEIAGSLPIALIPGTAGVRGGAAIGGASGLGMSEADNLIDQAKDSAKGAAIGGAVSYGLPKVMNAAGWLGKKTGNVLFGVGDEATEAYLRNPGAIKNAKPLKEITDDFLSKVDEVAGDTSVQSGKSFETLSRHYHDLATVTDPLVESSNQLRQIGLVGRDRKSAVKFLEGIAEDIDGLANSSGKVSLDKGKQVLLVLDAELKKMSKRQADTQAIKAVSDARKNLDEILKQISPEYKEQMAKLASDTEAAVGIGSKFRTEGGAEKLLQRVSRGKDQYSKEALEAFDNRFGTQFADDLQNAAVKNQFTRETTNGSRRTLLGTVAGSAIGAAVGGPMGSAVGSVAGAGAGATIDKVGGRIWQAVLDGTLKVGPYAKVLEEAAKRGPAAVGVTHLMLMKNYPDYREAVEGDQ